MTEIEPQPDQTPAELPVKSSQKFATYLSYHLDADWVNDLPPGLRWPFKALVTWTKKHQDELLAGLGDEQLDTFMVNYADLLLQLRSDDAIAVRVVALEGWSEDELAAFDYFQAHRAEIQHVLENRGAESHQEPLKELPSSEGPGDLTQDDEID